MTSYPNVVQTRTLNAADALTTSTALRAMTFAMMARPRFLTTQHHTAPVARQFSKLTKHDNVQEARGEPPQPASISDQMTMMERPLSQETIQISHRSSAWPLTVPISQSYQLVRECRRSLSKPLRCPEQQDTRHCLRCPGPGPTLPGQKAHQKSLCEGTVLHSHGLSHWQEHLHSYAT
jgi:hypothetical protein